jgi:hypothetical protein
MPSASGVTYVSRKRCHGAWSISAVAAGSWAAQRGHRSELGANNASKLQMPPSGTAIATRRATRSPRRM